MKLRPHHILDIVTGYGHGVEYKPHPYGHSQHIVAKAILSDVDIKIKLVAGADAVCQGCKHLLPDGQCADVLHQLDPPVSKQEYNDTLDYRLLDDLNLTNATVLSLCLIFKILNRKVPGIERICTHPERDQKERLNGLTKGLINLGIRSDS